MFPAVLKAKYAPSGFSSSIKSDKSDLFLGSFAHEIFNHAIWTEFLFFYVAFVRDKQLKVL